MEVQAHGPRSGGERSADPSPAAPAHRDHPRLLRMPVTGFDAEGRRDGELCPQCGSDATITYHFVEGFQELECEVCGYVSDSEELAALQRYSGEILEQEEAGSPIPAQPGRLKA